MLESYVVTWKVSYDDNFIATPLDVHIEPMWNAEEKLDAIRSALSYLTNRTYNEQQIISISKL